MKTKSIPPKLHADGIAVWCAHVRVVPIYQVKPNPRNPNTHPKAQIALLASIIKSQGWRNPIVISKRSGFVVKGHGRLLAAKFLKVKEVPVDDQDYATQAEEWADMVADNRIAELAETDTEILSKLIQELDSGSLDLTGYNKAELETLLAAKWEAPSKEKMPTNNPAHAIQFAPDAWKVIERAIAKLRKDEEDAKITPARALELIAADFLA